MYTCSTLTLILFMGMALYKAVVSCTKLNIDVFPLHCFSDDAHYRCDAGQGGGAVLVFLGAARLGHLPDDRHAAHGHCRLLRGRQQ